jgi:hypothetical protein
VNLKYEDLERTVVRVRIIAVIIILCITIGTMVMLLQCKAKPVIKKTIEPIWNIEE